MKITEFNKQFPTDDKCLDHLFNSRFGHMKECPSCKNSFKYYRVKNRKSYECNNCGNQIYPMAGTIFESSTTSLKDWYYVIYLFSVSKNGVSGKEIQRQLGVTYKCAWRIGHQVRKLMSGDTKLEGLVEVDESLYGGKSHGKRGWGAHGKVCLFGMIERNGNVCVKAVPNRKQETIIPIIENHVTKDSTINSDKYSAYKALPKSGYTHMVKNGKDIHINSMEGYWGNFKKAVLGTHTWVSPQHLQTYLNEFQFRHNNRKSSAPMFSLMLGKINEA